MIVAYKFLIAICRVVDIQRKDLEEKEKFKVKAA